jgi:hypothetical protein
MPEEGYEKATEESLADLNEAAGLLRDYPAAFGATLVQSRLMRTMFEQWARMGRFHIDFLNRTGGPETIRLAREINIIGKDLN